MLSLLSPDVEEWIKPFGTKASESLSESLYSLAVGPLVSPGPSSDDEDAIIGGIPSSSESSATSSAVGGDDPELLLERSVPDGLC